MNLAITISLYGGGPGSGCNGPNCGRPATFVRNTGVFDMPPAPAARGIEALHHYVVEPDGSSKKVTDHLTYFSKGLQNQEKAMSEINQFLRQGGITVTVSAGGPGIMFGKKDMETVDKVLQVAAHPEYREYGATVTYLNPKTGDRIDFDGGIGKLSREMRAWVSQKRMA